MIHVARTVPLLLGVAFACQPAPAPLPSESPAPAPLPGPVASSTPPVAVAPSASADAAAPPPGCMPPELAAEGRVVAAQLDSNEDLSFCIRKGIMGDAPTRCLALRFATKRFEGIEKLWPSVSFAAGPDQPENAAHAMMASNSGTLRVCGAGDQCMSVRLHPPKAGMFDEVFGTLPAVAVPGTSRVLVARLEETPTRTGPPKVAVYVDAFDLKAKAKVGSALAVRGQWAPDLWWIGKKALLETCTSDSDSCTASVIDPKSLGAKKLEIELAREEQLGSDASSLIQRSESGTVVVVDRGGASAVWLSPDGTVMRKQELGPRAADDAGVARVGHRNAHELVVLRPGPHAGSVVLLGIEDGAVTRFDAPVCSN